MKLRGIIFDFDGVIANTEPLHLRSYQDVLASTSLRLTDEDYYAHYLGYDDVGVFSNIGNNQGQPLNEDEIKHLLEEKSKRFDALMHRSEVLFPDATTCIEELANSVPLGIASGALHQEIETILTSKNLRRHFEVIVAADDVTHSKPAPDTYQRAVELLHGNHPGVEPSAYVAVEDSVWGITAAHAAGLQCIAVTHSYPTETLVSAEIIVNGLSDLKPTVFEQLGRPLN